MNFRKAKLSDSKQIWNIIQFAIVSRKKEGSNQWQDGYPNEKTILEDIDKGMGYVMCTENEILIYAALQTTPEPAYQKIQGAWLSDQPYMVIHRIAVSPNAKGKGLAKKLLRNAEAFAQQLGLISMRIDTHEDNHAMLHIIKAMGFTYCGEILVRGKPRAAFEKII